MTRSLVPDGVKVDVGRCVLNAFVPVHVLLAGNNTLLEATCESQYVLVTRSLVPDGVSDDVGRCVLNVLKPVHALLADNKLLTLVSQ